MILSKKNARETDPSSLSLAAANGKFGQVSTLALLCIVFGGFSLWISAFGDPFDYVDTTLLDQMLRWRYQTGLAQPVDPHVVHLDITSEDLRPLSSLTAEYENAATLIREATALGAKAVALDIVFERGTADDAQPILDAVDAAQRNNAVVLVGEAMVSGPSDTIKHSFSSAVRPPPSGVINVEPDADGVFRRYVLVRNGSSELEPSFALVTYLAWRGIDWEKDVKFPAPGLVTWPELRDDYSGVEWRTASVHPVLENFRSSWQGSSAFRHYSVAQLHQDYVVAQKAVTGNVAQAANAKPLADCIILVSYVGSGVGDLSQTPLGHDQPRAILHSTALNDLIQDSFLVEPSGLLAALPVASLIPLGLPLAFCRRTRSLIAFWLIGIFGLLLVGFTFICFSHMVIPAGAMAVIWSIAIVAETVRRRIFPARDRIANVQGVNDLGSQPRVFISAKSEDYQDAGKVYQFLTSRGIPTFLSNESLPNLGRSDYRKEIDRALDSCQHMIVVTSSVGNALSTWVEAEWGIFVNEQRSGRKRGNLITVTTKTFETGKLPPALRSNEIIRLEHKTLEKIAGYVSRDQVQTEMPS
ncbi:MAG: CHASE2 domain-containing protein [Verrucomicrobia bacterium]|nr:CHASE2 domain-containing protein [Verrucomicrobiota bacterium]MBV8481798.1 CHASE2 domain-containing protein [Verrucomicrobiota bacterium]